RDRRHIVRDVRTGPTTAVPVHILLRLAPGLALRIRRSAVVLDAAIGRPAEAPVRVDAQPRRIAVVPALREIPVWTVHTCVDPHGAVCRPIVPHLAEAGELLAGPADDVAFGVPEVRQSFAVELFQEFVRRWIEWVRVLPAHVEKRLCALASLLLVELANPCEQ